MITVGCHIYRTILTLFSMLYIHPQYTHTHTHTTYYMLYVLFHFETKGRTEKTVNCCCFFVFIVDIISLKCNIIIFFSLVSALVHKTATTCCVNHRQSDNNFVSTIRYVFARKYWCVCV